MEVGLFDSLNTERPRFSSFRKRSNGLLWFFCLIAGVAISSALEQDAVILLRDREALLSGDKVESEPAGFFLDQKNDGVLELYQRIGQSNHPLWSSKQPGGPLGLYYSIVQGDANFITRQGTPSNKGKVFWKSKARSTRSNDHFLVMIPSKELIAIYDGTPENPGRRVWAEETFAVLPPTSFQPTSLLPTFSPTTPSTIVPSPQPTLMATTEPTESFEFFAPTNVPSFLPSTVSPTLSPTTAPSPTKEPSNPPSPTQAPPQFVVLLQDNGRISSDEGERPIGSLSGVTFHQATNGRFVIEGPLGLIWRSTLRTNMGTGCFFTTLQRDGNLITRRCIDNKLAWKSQFEGGSVGPIGQHFLALDAMNQELVIYQGDIANLGDIRWNIATNQVLAPPTVTTPSPTPTSPTMPSTNSPTPQPSPTMVPPPKEDVVIIGAGWSGLAAAKHLLDNSITKVKIIEARDYIGGRSHTLNNVVEGLPIELGSAQVLSINNPNNQVQRIIDEAGLNYGTTEYLYSSFEFYEPSTLSGKDASGGNSRLSDEEKTALFNKVWTGSNGFTEYAWDEGDSLWEEGLDQNAEEVVEEFVQSKDTFDNEDKQFLNAMVNTELTTDSSGPLDDISFKETAYYFGEGGASNYMGVPGGGFQNAVLALAQPFIDRIQLESQVTSINYEEDDLVRITYTDGNGDTHTVDASAVIVTVPLGVLKAGDIEFVPTLPNRKLGAIESIGYGNLNKLIMYWEDPSKVPWQEDKKTWLSLLTEEDDTSGGWNLFFNGMSQDNGNHAILVGFVGGDDADAIESQTDEEILSEALSNLRIMFGEDNVPYPTKHIVTRWRKDKFSRGCYSYTPEGVRNGNARGDLRYTIGNVFWAGEATNGGNYGTTNGAYDTGVRAATAFLETVDNT